MIGYSLAGSHMKKDVLFDNCLLGLNGRKWPINVSVEAHKDVSLLLSTHIYFIKSSLFCSFMSSISSPPNRLDMVTLFYGMVARETCQ
jgi:hypothetical protein